MREAMMSVETPARQSTAARRAGYAIAAAINGVMLYLVNGRPGWDAIPFLTDVDRVLPWINAALVMATAANLIYLIVPGRRFVAAGGLVTTGLGVAVLIRLWQVFPFDFGRDAGWTMVVRAVLLLAIVGSVIALPVPIFSVARPSRHG
jgi:hypothetical protein